MWDWWIIKKYKNIWKMVKVVVFRFVLLKVEGDEDDKEKKVV